MNEKSHVGMIQCFYCWENYGIAITKRLHKTLPQSAVYNMEPCPKCKGYMDQGIIIIGIENDTRDDEMDGNGQMPNPRRVGLFCVLREEAFTRMPINGSFITFGLKHRFVFITEEAWDALGLPREDINNMKKEGESNNEQN